MTRWLLVLLYWITITEFAASQVALAQKQPIQEAADTYKTGGKAIPIHRFEPQAKGKYPAIVLLHGSGGPVGAGTQERESARELAGHGYVVLLPHYFESTGYKPDPDKAAELQDVRGWTQAINDAITFAGKQPTVNSQRIGLLGFSYGAYLAVAIGGQNSKVKAVSEWSGIITETTPRNLRYTPPILILHGEDDEVAPLENARKLAQVWKTRRRPYEIKTYPRQGHGFTGKDAEDALERTIAFFDKHLKK